MGSLHFFAYLCIRAETMSALVPTQALEPSSELSSVLASQEIIH